MGRRERRVVVGSERPEIWGWRERNLVVGSERWGGGRRRTAVARRAANRAEVETERCLTRFREAPIV